MTQSERIKIAQELHDGIAQDLVALSYSLDLLIAEPLTPAATRVELRNLIFSVASMIEKVRTEIFNLRSQVVPSLEKSLRALLLELRAPIELRIAQEECGLSNLVESEILAISRELLRNSVKHSGASVIEISLEKGENGSTYTFKDNGRGFDHLTHTGYGFRGIQERCSSIESELTVVSNENGTNYLISIP